MFSQKYNDEKHILKVRNDIKNELISFHSPLIRKRIEEIAKYEAINKNAIPDPYLTDLAKVHIFMDKYKSRTKNPLLGELFEEQLFATYEYCKDNNLYYGNFNDLFNTGKFFTFLGVTTNDIWFSTKTKINPLFLFNKNEFITKEYEKDANGKNISFITNRIAINTHSQEIDYSSYNASLNHTGTHEAQHFVTGKGTYDKKYLFGGYLNQGQNNLNELCIEKNATNIIKNYLDDSIEPKTITKTFKDTKKNITFISENKDYKELTSFYEPIDYITGNKLRDICYTKGVNINSIGSPEIVDKLLDFTKSYNYIYDSNDKNNLFEDKFDTMIDSFSLLAEQYVREKIALTQNTDPRTKEGAEKISKTKEFFDTFDSISFKKESENFYQRDLIKEKVLGAIYNNDKSSDTAIKRLEGGKTYTQQFKSAFDTANFTLGKTLSQKWGIDFSKDLQNKDNSKDNSKNKENSKDIDLDL